MVPALSLAAGAGAVGRGRPDSWHRQSSRDRVQSPGGSDLVLLGGTGGAAHVNIAWPSYVHGSSDYCKGGCRPWGACLVPVWGLLGPFGILYAGEELPAKVHHCPQHREGDLLRIAGIGLLNHLPTKGLMHGPGGPTPMHCEGHVRARQPHSLIAS